MAAALPLRLDFSASDLRGQARRRRDANQARRLLALAATVESGPIPAVHGVVRWRLIDLAHWVWEEFRLSVSPQTISRVLRGLGYRKLSARPRHHAQALGAVEDFTRRWRLDSA